MSLDHLVAVYFQTEEVDPDGEADAPGHRYAEFYQSAAKAFPELGLYPHVYPGGDPGASGPI
jgi:hypothetical protein